MKYGIFSTVFLLTLTVAVVPVAHAEEPLSGPVSFFAAPFKVILRNLEERKENKEVNKNVRNEIIEKVVNENPIASSQQNKPVTLNNLADRLSLNTIQLGDIANRLDSRIKKIEEQDVDLSFLKNSLNDAEAKIDVASSSAAELKIILKNTTATSTHELSTTTQALIDSTVKNITEIHSILEQITQSIAKNYGETQSQ